MSRNVIAPVSAMLLVAAAVGFESPRVYTQPAALDVVPIVGHWRVHTEGSEPVATVDGTKWDKKPLADPLAIARELFKAPSGEAGSPFVANAASSGAFPLAAVRGVDGFTNGSARVQFKLIAGASDQLAGLVFSLRPTGEYLAVRYNTKDGNVALWKYVDGARARLADGTGHAQLPLDVWHVLELQVVDRKVTGIVNGTLRVEHTLEQPVSGRVGLWAKPDSVSAFKGLRIQK